MLHTIKCTCAAAATLSITHQYSAIDVQYHLFISVTCTRFHSLIRQFVFMSHAVSTSVYH